MVYYYLDIETYGRGDRPNPLTDPVISIVFCAIDPATGRRIQEPVLLKSWETSEEQVVRQLCDRMLGKSPFDFVPVGFSVPFDLWFLTEKFRKYCGVQLDFSLFIDRPYLDLKHVAVLANKGVFKGVSLTGGDGARVAQMYEQQDWTALELHVYDKLDRFLNAYEHWAALLNE